MSPRVRPRPDVARDLPELPRPAGRVLDAHLHLLDRQVLDVEGVPVTTVDDLLIVTAEGEQVTSGDQPAFVDQILTGPVLATRVLGGRPPASRLLRIPWSDVTDVGVAVRLGVRGEGLDVTWVQRWLRDHVVGRIPGGRHDPG